MNTTSQGQRHVALRYMQVAVPAGASRLRSASKILSRQYINLNCPTEAEYKERIHFLRADPDHVTSGTPRYLSPTVVHINCTLNSAISLLTTTFPPPPNTACALPAPNPPHYSSILTLTPSCRGPSPADPRLRTRLQNSMNLKSRRLRP